MWSAKMAAILLRGDELTLIAPGVTYLQETTYILNSDQFPRSHKWRGLAND